MIRQAQVPTVGDGTPAPGEALRGLAGTAGCVGVLLLGALALNQPGPGTPGIPARMPALPVAVTGALPPPVQVAGCSMAPGGYVTGRWFGALDLAIDWAGPGLGCEGMLRPDGQGVRLLFARQYGQASRLVLVLGIDADPAALPGPERPTNVTVIDEQSGRFFSTAGSVRCWTDIQSVEALPADTAGTGEWRVTGMLYCAGPLPALTDRSALTLGDTRFAGRFSQSLP